MRRLQARWEHFDHGADIGVRVYALYDWMGGLGATSASSARFFRGIAFDPPRAGMRASTSLTARA